MLSSLATAMLECLLRQFEHPYPCMKKTDQVSKFAVLLTSLRAPTDQILSPLRQSNLPGLALAPSWVLSRKFTLDFEHSEIREACCLLLSVQDGHFAGCTETNTSEVYCCGVNLTLRIDHHMM